MAEFIEPSHSRVRACARMAGPTLESRLVFSAAALYAILCLPACSSSDVPPPTPGITLSQCPGLPTGASINALAPYWNGLYTVSVNVPGGAPDSLELDVLDPTQNAWVSAFGQTFQTADGKFVVELQPPVSAASQSSTFQVRVRARLAGCAPTPWADAGSIAPGDPLQGSAWVGTWDPAELSGSLSVNRVDLTGATTPAATAPTLSKAVKSTVTFSTDGTVAEAFELSFDSAGAQDPFAACKLSLHFTGTWSWQFTGSVANVIVSERKPAADASAGSDCAFPAPADLSLSDATLNASMAIPATVLSPYFDYSGLLATPAEPVTWQNSQLSSDLSTVLSFLSYSATTESGALIGYVTPVLGLYQKQ
ncbi:MAG TPA: hypothetical protein VGM29_08640 [Polyangiaceae bacterium]|jgi:hypothetical protein